ncbi:Hdbt inhibited cytochrome Bc1 complex [Nadsonia fulvescens var. elongata DSM 6958]|uniref:Cytochrome b-c1 complex subunit 7 n=1 Tax=Nadsonia fulvescens var. elongata DSM 6958 TaxID=857566 RepID=A0A1E3PER2_9ASCO|nr:Hdbt inhibited cytochrome Bc1 complex [Nadsonia fulvescens var. elongata DSM 6958]
MSTFIQTAKIADFVLSKPGLAKIAVPIASWFANAAGYRKIGLKYEDLITEENPTVQTALKRLDAKESYDRVFRLATAHQCSLSHKLLPKNEWVKTSDDKPYISQYIKEIEQENQERVLLDNIVVSKKN